MASVTLCLDSEKAPKEKAQIHIKEVKANSAIPIVIE